MIAVVATDRCTGCGRCVSVCPTSAIVLEDRVAKIDQNRCTGCGQCVSVCPQKGIMLSAR
ncbi:MAG: 4Fe-4S dicluster domain-containing protein [Chitinivibrionales bacterium]|nr:4Fe-4S dicluster domain-containing protein [Chitinivibrionales bacterium]